MTRDDHVLVLGLGASGLAMARWCARAGARVSVADTRDAPPQLAALRAALPEARFLPGPLAASLLTPDITRVLRSPGLSPAAIAPISAALAPRGLRAEGELDLFAQALRDLRAERGYAPRVLAITGTNGKTTVTALTGRLVEQAGKSVALAGNIGPTLLDTLSARLDADALPEVWALELSSFQLDGVLGFEPTAATVLNLTQDHLDWHGSMQAYGAAKARIFGQQALMVLNRDDPAVMAMHASAAAPARPAHSTRAPAPRACTRFGSDAPEQPGDWGLHSVHGMTWLVRAAPDDGPRRARSPAHEADLLLQRLMPADALRIAGRHNALNALAALALASAAGCALGAMLHALRDYRGEPHRVESLGLIDGVEYFDDSKGTNVGATAAALDGLGASRAPARLVVILGGDGKGQDFAPLLPPLARHARAALLIGRDAPRIRAAVAGAGVALHAADTLEQAVAQARALARPGDAVLLSPACASFDMFSGYEHRAQVFRDAVTELAREQGVVP